MRAFVAGATGYTGRELVRVLRERGHEVAAHVRPDSPSLARWRQEFGAQGASVDSAPWHAAAMSAALGAFRPTHVFALLGTTRRRMRSDGGQRTSYDAVDYGLTALLLQATLAAAPDARFIYLSSLGASERGNAYLRVRGRLERELRASGLSWIAARPAFVTGADREEPRLAERLAARASDALLHAFAVVGVREPAHKYSSLTGEALANALASLAEASPDGVYEAGALRERVRRAGAGS